MSNLDVAAQDRPLVLVIDDEASICSSLARVLEDESYETLVAHSGPVGLELVRKYRPAVVFLDMWMPGWDGITTLERIKEVAPETAVIVISGHATIPNALEATKRGAFDFIEKPLDIESIVFSAARALEQRDLVRRSGTTFSNHVHGAASERGLFTHPGVLSTGLKGRDIGQRTITSSTVLYGQCLHSGQKSGLILEPLPENSGIHFGKIGSADSIPAFVDSVESTGFATTVRSGPVSVGTIEHLMAALHAYRITNLLIKCNDEVPIFDGSSARFCDVIEEVGIEEQSGSWYEIAVDKPLVVSGSPNGHAEDSAEELITIEPADCFSLRYELAYPAPVGRQAVEFRLDSVNAFKEQIAPARTFGFMRDIERLQRAGLAAGGRLDNFILIGDNGVVNTELRFPDELARHKILDAIGDSFLLGRPLRAKITARMTGHSDNISLLRVLKPFVLGAS